MLFRSVFAEENTLKNIEVLNTEYPFTKFFDGAILVGRYGSEPFADSTEIKIGDQINLWQILNYDQKIIETGSYDKLIIKKILGK